MFRASGAGIILLVGEGNFSFTVSLVKACSVEDQFKYYATSYESREECMAKYGEDDVGRNITYLHHAGAHVYFGVDATSIHESLARNFRQQVSLTFDLIVFQFPHTGRKASIAANRQLLKNFFLSARRSLTPESGNIVVTLCGGQGGTAADSVKREHCNSWQVVEMAAYSDMILTEVSCFDQSQFMQYEPTGRRNAGNAFITNKAMSHKFAWSGQIPPLSTGWDSTPVNANLAKGLLQSSYLARRMKVVTEEPETMPQFLLEKRLLEGLAIDADVCYRLQSFVDKNTIIRDDHSLSCRETVGECSSCGPSFCLRPSLLAHASAILDIVDDAVRPMCSCHGLVFPSVAKEGILCTSPVNYQLLIIQRGSTKFDLANRLENVVNCYSSRPVSICIEGSCQESETDIAPIMASSISLNKCCDIFAIHDGSKEKIGSEHVTSDEANGGTGTIIFTLLDLDRLASSLNSGLLCDQSSIWSLDLNTRLRILRCLKFKVRYDPRSLYPPSYAHDFSFWVPRMQDKLIGGQEIRESDIFNVLRSSVDDLACSLKCLDVYEKGNATSLCYRVIYRSQDYAMSRDDSNRLQQIFRENISRFLKVNLR